MTKQELQNKILAEYKKGNVVVFGLENELAIFPLQSFIQQPAAGILYDLNRLEEVVLTFIDDPKWVNDFAVCKTIRALKARINELEQPQPDA